MRSKFPFLFLVVCLAALSACSLPQVRTATPAERPTAASTDDRPVVPTDTTAPTETSAPTPTLAPLPTPTWAPGCPPANLSAKTLPDQFAIADLPGAGYFGHLAAMEFKSGWLIDFTDENDPTVFGLETFGYQGQDYILLERVVCNAPDGQAYYLVLDVMPLPAMNPDENFGIDVACLVNGVHEEKVLAVAQVPEDLTSRPFNMYGFELGPVRLAWLANIETGRFEPISTDGLRCYMQVMGP